MHRSISHLMVSLLLTIVLAGPVQAQGYSVDFNKANITEFIDTISLALGRTILVDPAVKGTVTVRVFNDLSEEQYYQLFLSVLEINGYVAIPLSNDTLKVVKNNKSKETIFPLTDQFGNPDDSMVTWVLPVNNVPARELAPILRQMTSNYGTVVNFNAS